MSNKLTALTAATLPLAGTEAVYVVQGGNSRQTTAAAVIASCSIIANNETITGTKTYNSGKLQLAGSTSGVTILNATAAASGTLTLPAATDTLVGRATTDTLTNKTFDTAGAGNSFLINGLAATANTGTGAVVRATGPAIDLTNATGLVNAGVASGAAIASTKLANTQTGTGAVSRTIQSKFAERISVKDFGAVGDGSTDDTTAIQNALNAIKTLGGGTLYIPGTSTGYKITSGLTYDVSALTGRFNSRLQIIGDGPATSFLTLSGVAAAALTITGNASYPEMYCHFEGFRLTGNSTVGSKGLVLSICAFGTADGLVCEAFDYNFDGTDVEQVQFANTNFRWGIHGMRFNASVSTTSPNSMVFTNCNISNNSTWGWQITNANAVTFVGGSTQYNGATGGGSGNWGGNIIEAGNGYGTVSFLGHIFEGNGGNADFLNSQSTNVATFIFEGCGFARPNSTSYAVSFIEIDGTQACTYIFSSNTLRGYSTYVANAARPYFTINNTSAKVWDDGSNIYGSATEQPAWAGTAQIPVFAHVGAGSTQIGTFTARGGTDKNFYVGNNFNLADGIAFGSINDANNTFKGMEFRASSVLISAAATVNGAMLSKSPTGGVGYSTGAGGTVTQATSRTTGVTLNTASGAITMFTAAASATPATFTVTNSAVAATDTISLNVSSGANASNAYIFTISAVAAGSFNVTFWSASGTNSDTPVLHFNVIKGVSA